MLQYLCYNTVYDIEGIQKLHSNTLTLFFKDWLKAKCSIKHVSKIATSNRFLLILYTSTHTMEISKFKHYVDFSNLISIF